MKGAGPVIEVDIGKLWKAINYRLFRTGKNARHVADLLGFTPQVFSNIKAAASQGLDRGGSYQPSGPVLLSICWWLDADPRDFHRKVRPVTWPAGSAEEIEAADGLIDSVLDETRGGAS